MKLRSSGPIATRVLVVDDDGTSSRDLAAHLAARRYDVQTCPTLEGTVFAVAHWRPHVLVIAATAAQRHERLEELRRLYPRLPLVVLTAGEGPELLLDLEAFAPTVSACPARGLSHIESAVAAASTFA
jgi:AmiR/NasT family two-component response regulator